MAVLFRSFFLNQHSLDRLRSDVFERPHTQGRHCFIERRTMPRLGHFVFFRDSRAPLGSDVGTRDLGGCFGDWFVGLGAKNQPSDVRTNTHLHHGSCDTSASLAGVCRSLECHLCAQAYGEDCRASGIALGLDEPLRYGLQQQPGCHV